VSIHIIREIISKLKDLTNEKAPADKKIELKD
jgi:hypothetical protein